MNHVQTKETFCKPADERAVLSFCMRDISFYYTVCSKLVPEDFLYEQHSMLMLLFRSLLSMDVEKFDTNVIVSEAQSSGIIDNIGGLKYIQAISNMVQLSDSNFEVYLNSVIEASCKYKLYCVLQENVSTVVDNSRKGMTSSDLISKSESNLMGLSMGNLNIDEPKNLADGLVEEIERRRDLQISVSGLSTGYPLFDKQIDGMIDGTLLVMAARKKMGKSALLSNIALHVAYREMKPVLYVDTEMTFDEWRDSAISVMAGVKEREFKHGGYSDETYNRLIKATKIIDSGKKLFHEYMPGYSVDKLVALYKRYKQKEDIGLIVFDYLKEPDSSSVDRQRKEYQLLGDITTKLKDLAGRLSIPALTAVQLNRSNDIADSDRIARYGDVICHWASRDKDEMEEGGNSCGSHKLIIKDTRRGGATNSHGIGYNFFKEYLVIKEVRVDKQYFTNFDKIADHESALAFGGLDDDELS